MSVTSQRVQRPLTFDERALIDDLLQEIRQVPWSYDSHRLEANLYSLLPEVQLDDADTIYPAGHWRHFKVNRNPPPLADIVCELEEIADRFRIIRRQHGFMIERNCSRYPSFDRKLIKEEKL